MLAMTVQCAFESEFIVIMTAQSGSDIDKYSRIKKERPIEMNLLALCSSSRSYNKECMWVVLRNMFKKAVDEEPKKRNQDDNGDDDDERVRRGMDDGEIDQGNVYFF